MGDMGKCKALLSLYFFHYIYNMELPITEIQLFQILKQRLGDKETEALVSFVDAKAKDANDRNLQTLATKADLKDEIGRLREDMAKQETRLSQTIYIVGVVQFLAIIGSVFVLMKYGH
jgi:hypothetical protein